MTDCHILVMSDIHLGSRVCRADKVLELLKKTEFDILIVNGDLFDSNKTRKLTQKHWEVISTLSNIAKDRKVMLVGGNHGRELDVLAKEIGMEIKNEHAFILGNNRFLCLHGDEFDILVKYLPTVSDLFGRLYYLIQKLDGKNQRASVFMKLLTKKVLGVPRRQERLALRRGAASGAQVVICSHTHIPHIDSKNGILFINSGSFCDIPATYVSITKDGKAELMEI